MIAMKSASRWRGGRNHSRRNMTDSGEAWEQYTPAGSAVRHRGVTAVSRRLTRALLLKPDRLEHRLERLAVVGEIALGHDAHQVDEPLGPEDREQPVHLRATGRRVAAKPGRDRRLPAEPHLPWRLHRRQAGVAE